MTLFHIKNKGKQAIFFALLIITLFMLVSCGNWSNFVDQDKADASGLSQPEESATPDPQETIEPPKVAEDPAVQSEAPQPSPTEEEITGPDLPEREPQDDEFFSDAAFMGNSLMDGFRLFSGLTTCDYYAATSMTVVAVDSKYCVSLDNGNSGTLVDGLMQKPYGKIYILLGINEIGFDVSTFIDYYSTMLDTIIAAQPDGDIYIMGLTPVSAAKSAGSDVFNMTRITDYNTALHELAAEKGCYYMDLVSALAGPDGYLPADVTSDGVHFSAQVYKTWLNYVRTHYV